MNYIEVGQLLRKHNIYLFSLEGLVNLFPDENRKAIKNNLLRWVDKGYILRLKRDLYEFVDKERGSGVSDLYVANKLYGPSYVSLETALSFYSIIPDIAANAMSVTTGPTRSFKNRYGAFFYRTCRKKAFTGYRIITSEGLKVCIADKEKALVDYLYYKLRSPLKLVLKEERFNKDILRKLDWKKALRYAKLFNRRTFETVKRCKEHIYAKS